MTQAWFWPPSGQAARSQALAPFAGTETLVLDAFQALAWPFGPSGMASISLSGSGAFSIRSAVADASGGVYALGANGNLFYVASGSTVTVSTLASGIYGAVTLASGTPYAIQRNSGKIVSGTTVETTVYGPTIGLTVAGSNFVTLSPSYSGGAALAFAAIPGGAPSYVLLPSGVAVPTCVAAASGYVAVGGWGSTILSGNFTAMAADSAVAAQVAAVGSGNATVYSAPTSGSNTWTKVTSLTGVTAAPVSCSWTPDGTQILIADTANNALQVLLYSGGTLSITQTLTVSGAAGVVATDSTHALATGNNDVTPLLYSTTWAVQSGNIVGVSGATAIVALSATSAAVAMTSGVSWLSLISGSWSVTASAELTFTPTNLTTDSQGNIYAGAPGANFAFIAAGTTAVAGTGSWSGDCAGLAAYNRQAVAYDASGFNGYRVLGNPSAGSVWSSQSSGTSLAGGKGLLFVDKTLFAYGTTGAQLFNFGAPYTLGPVETGAVSLYNLTTSGFATAVLGPDHVPSALAWNSTGVWAGTIQNDLYGITTSATIGVTGSVPQYSPQAQTVPLGVGAIEVSGSAVLVATSMAGLLVQAQ